MGDPTFIVLSDSPYSLVKRFPGIACACLRITRDNPGVYRTSHEATVFMRINNFLIRVAGTAFKDFPGHFRDIEPWLASLEEAELTIVCSGGHEEIRLATALAPVGTNALLEKYFEEEL